MATEEGAVQMISQGGCQMAEVKHIKTIRDQVYQILRDEICAGKYAPGSWLQETELTEYLGVSRSPVREALRRLEQERLIRDSGKGSVVLGITLEDLEDIMDIRLRCEGLAAFYAAKNRTEADAKRLRQLSELQDFYFEKGDYDHLREIDDEFHESIYEISGRTVLMDTLRPLHRKTQRYRRNSYSIPARRQKSINEHKAICDAICDGNAELAEQLVSQHIENAKNTMIERFSQNG